MFNNLLGQAQRFLEKKKKQLRPVVQAVQKKLQPITSAIGNIIPKAPPVSPPLRNIPQTFTKPVVQPVSKPLFTPRPAPAPRIIQPARPSFLQSAGNLIKEKIVKPIQSQVQTVQKQRVQGVPFPFFTTTQSIPQEIAKKVQPYVESDKFLGGYFKPTPKVRVRDVIREIPGTIIDFLAPTKEAQAGAKSYFGGKTLTKEQKRSVGIEELFGLMGITGGTGKMGGLSKEAVEKIAAKLFNKTGNVVKEIAKKGEQIVSKNAPPLLGKVAQQVEEKGSQLFKSIKGAPREKQAQILADIMEKETNRGQLFGKATPKILPPVEGGVSRGGKITPPLSPIVKPIGGGEVGQVAERGLVKPKATLFGKEAKIKVPSFKNGISPQATTPLQQTIVPSKKQISPPLNESIPDLKPRQTILNKIDQMKQSIANDEAYELALNMPTKSEMVIPRIKEIAELKVLKGKAKQVRDLVYNSELDPNIKFSIVKDNGRALEITANQDYREWQTQVFKQAGTRTTGEAIDDITGMIKNKTVSPMARDVENLKDISGFSAQTRDVFRNFKAVYGKRFEEVKPLLDKFINSKGKFIDDLDNWANKVHKEIEINLGIKKGTRLSAAVQEFGEGSLDQRTLIKELGEDKANKVTQADMWFRVAYDQLLSEVNVVRARIYPNDPTKIIPRRQDYYRHFRDLQQGFSGLVNIFDTPANIESSLSGVSEFTKPKSKWLSFAQKRLGLQTEVDAVGGFLDYIKASSYAKNIDPNISTFRNLAEELAQGTLEGPNKGKLNNFIEFLQDFSNDLSGKTNPADRFIQKVIPGGRKAFRVINWMNNRVKANVILGNLSSSIAQIFNVPQGMASVQNPVYWIKGLGDSLASMFVKNQPIEQSIFLKERNFNSFDQFDRGMLNNIKKFAVWSIKVLDEIGSKYIWNMHYEKALAEQIANPISYADDLTRDLVAGRGIGEVPLLQKSKMFQLVAPFQLEVGNLWHVMKDFVDEKAFGKLATMFFVGYVFNKAAEQIKGSGVSFDPVEAMIDSFNTLREEEDKKIGIIKAGGRLAGEVLSNVPLGQTAAALYPEFGLKIPGTDETLTRKEFFGKEDPTRFGGGALLTKGLQDPLYKLLPPFGGQQIKRTIEGVGSVNKGYSETKTGRVRFPIEKNLTNFLQGGVFGQYAVPEAKEFFNKKRSPLGKNQSALFKGANDKKNTYSDLITVREVNKKKEQQKKTDTERIQPFYDELQIMKAEGNKAEADKIYFALPEADRKIYKSIEQAAKTKQINILKLEMYPLVKELQAMKEQGGKSEADKIYFALSADKRVAYKLAKKELGIGETTTPTPKPTGQPLSAQ